MTTTQSTVTVFDATVSTTIATSEPIKISPTSADGRTSLYAQNLCSEAILCTNGSNPNQQLLRAAQEGCLEEVEKIAECNITDVNTQDNDGRTPLYLASFKNHTQVVNFLLSHADIDINLGTEYNGETALIVSTRHGYSHIVRLLLDNDKIDLNKGLTDTGLTALIVASKFGHYTIVQMLLDHPLISVNSGLFTTGVTPLVAAIKNGHDAVVKLFLSHPKVDVNLGPKNGKSPLIVAASSINSSISSVRLLLTKPGINVNTAVFDGQTALFFAVKSKNYDVVELLLRCPKTDTLLFDDEYKTAQDYATENNLEEIANAFETRGVLTKEKGHSCCSDNINRGLLMAVEDSDLTWVETFLPCPQIDLNIGNQDGETALNIAAREGYNAIAEILLSNPNIDTNKYNVVNGKTALMLAAEAGKWEVIKMLLSNAQINVDIRDIDGENAFQKAASGSHLMAVKLLLRCPKTKVGNIVVKNDDIKEAINLRASLLKVGPTCCLKVADGLLQAATNGYQREIRGLLQCPDSDSNIIDRKGRTPLYLASWKGHNMAVQVLLEDQNIDTNIGKPLDGGTPFSISSEEGHFKVMQQLISHGNNGHCVELIKGWCKDNWTPGIVMCKEPRDDELKTATTTITNPGAGQ